MSGHRRSSLICAALVLAVGGCQTDGARQFAWNPFRKSVENNPSVENDSSFSLARLSRKKDDNNVESSSSSSSPMATQQLERLLTQGQIALQENDLEEARDAYTEVLNSSPDNATAHHGLAMAADLAEKWDDAEYHYRQALRIRPRDPNLLCDIGYSYLLQNRYLEAERYLNHALEIQPEHDSALMNLAMLDLRQGKRGSAEQRIADRYGSSGQVAQVLAQLEQQVAGLGGGVMPVSATSSRSDASFTDTAGSIPANASFAEIQEVARRERIEAERRRATQGLPDESARAGMVTNSLPANVPANAGPGTSPGDTSSGYGVSASPQDRNVVPSGPTAYSNQPRHIFGTLQPRTPSDLNHSANNSMPASGMGPSAALPNGPNINPAQWQNSREPQNIGAPTNGPGVPHSSGFSGQNMPLATAVPGSIGVVMPGSGVVSGSRPISSGDSSGSHGFQSAQGNSFNSGLHPSQDPSLSNNTLSAAAMHAAGPNSPVAHSAGINGPGYQGANPGMSSQGNAAPHENSNLMSSNMPPKTPGTSQGAGPGFSASNENAANAGVDPNSGRPIPVRSSGAFQSLSNNSNSYGVPYGFGPASGPPAINTVSNSHVMAGQGNSTSSTAGASSAQGMYLDGLNVGPGMPFPVGQPGGTPQNQAVQPSGTLQGFNNSSGYNPGGYGASPGATTQGQGGNPNGNFGSGTMNSGGQNPGTGSDSGVRMGNISSPGTGSMINGGMYSQPESNLPAAAVLNGPNANGGINSAAQLPGWPAARPGQMNPLEAYERQRQHLDDEYNRTLQQLDRNSPATSSRAQY